MLFVTGTAARRIWFPKAYFSSGGSCLGRRYAPFRNFRATLYSSKSSSLNRPCSIFQSPPLTTHHSPLTTHHSPLTTQHSLLTSEPNCLVNADDDQDQQRPRTGADDRPPRQAADADPCQQEAGGRSQ